MGVILNGIRVIYIQNLQNSYGGSEYELHFNMENLKIARCGIII
jgi:hypothetical protein